jgi:hypothetical protein
MGREAVEVVGEEGGERPAAANDPAGSLQNSSCSLSEFHA